MDWVGPLIGLVIYSYFCHRVFKLGGAYLRRALLWSVITGGFVFSLLMTSGPTPPAKRLGLAALAGFLIALVVMGLIEMTAGTGAAGRQAAAAEFQSLSRMLGGQLRTIPRLFSDRTELTGLYEKHRVFVSALRKPRYPGGSATSARIEFFLPQPSPRTFSVEQGGEASAPLPPELRERLSRVAGGTQGHWRLRVQREKVLLDLRVLGVPGADLLHVWLDWLVALASVLTPTG